MERRNTIQKNIVYETVMKSYEHPTAEHIYGIIAREYPTVSRATVYRNLNLLAEEGRVRRVEVPGEAERFDRTLREHYHVACLKCHGVFDVDMEPVTDIFSRVSASGGFRFLGYDIVFKGICPACLKAKENAAPDDGADK